jgi:hypothetical protein
MKPIIAVLVIVCSLAALLRAEVKSQGFDQDPGWEGFQNRIAPKAGKTVKQDFGYRESNFAGKAMGEIGGTIWRSATPASYAAEIGPRTLDDKLSASGTFAITATAGSSGAFFGFFKADGKDHEDAGRQNSLGFRFAGEGSGARLTLQLVTAKNQACGTKVTPWVVDKTKPKGPERKFRPTSIRNDGTRYTWTLDYDPAANGGEGQIRFAIRSNAETHEEFESKTFEVNLPKGYRQHGTTFDRFGLVNSMRPGNPMTLYFDDLEFEGKAVDFSADAQWVGVGNSASYERKDEGGAHDFGFSAGTSSSGGKSAGELGGMIWRSGAYAYYADRVGPLSMEDRLEASGTIVLSVGSPDSGMQIGWFNSAEKELAPTQAGQFVGARIGGPTRVGHYFVPAYATLQATPPKPTGTREHPASVSVEKGTGPVLTPRKVFDWKLVYDPSAAGGKGAVTATLGEESVTLELKPGDKAKGAAFDRFGLFTTHRGGSYVKIYFDDLTYTASRP